MTGAEAGTDRVPDQPPTGVWRDSSGWHRAWLLVLIAACLLTAMMAVLGIAMWRDDLVIDADPVQATATVLTVTPLTTGIEFVDNHGVSQRPASGVLYPGGLVVGQQFLVEYAASDPTRVRVAGRSAINGVIMPALVVVVCWAIAAPLLWWLRRRDHRIPADLVAAIGAHRLHKRP